MTDIAENKRLNDEELEAVAGGVTPLTIDPATAASLAHLTVGSAVAGGGAYMIDTHTPAHTDSGTPTITGQTHTTVSGSAIFGNETSLAPQLVPVSSLGPVVHGTVTLSGNLHFDVPAPPPDQTVTVMHFDSQQGEFTHVTPRVSAVDESGKGPGIGGALGRSWGNW